ncbi:MAG: hypothetical protein BroJett003_07200 [Planctomycetota bacterium]|nr:MAG: hypothetical protein BroJett003_07200 [Planctomycetota bacterium]
MRKNSGPSREMAQLRGDEIGRRTGSGDEMNHEEKLESLRRQIRQLQAEAAALESALAEGAGGGGWAPPGYYTTYHILAGMVLGFIGAVSSLMFNVVGAAMLGRHPLQLIQVYLTFPLGEKALALDDGFTLAAGCCLYLGTGMIGGVPFHLILSRWFESAGLGKRFVVATGLSLGVWVVNFYGVLSWMQPLLIGGNWIVEQVPVYVAAATHLVFGWTMLLVDAWGRFTPPAGSFARRAQA